MQARRYQEELNALSGHTHGRNARLVRLALLGLAAGRDPQTLAEEIVAAGGEPRLTDAEVRRAIQTAGRRFSSASAAPQTNRLPPFRKPLEPRPPTTRERNFVREMISAGKGAKSSDLRGLSPVEWGTVPVAAAFLGAIFRPDDLVFVGTPFRPRTRENLMTAKALADGLSAPGAELPTHLVPNPFSGEPGRNAEGKVSYCLDATVAHRRLALVEFDELPLEEQAAFWRGVIEGRLLPVRSLVYSGAKSIHGLVELVDDGTAAKWSEQWRTLERLLCSDPDPAYHADRACKNAARFTRFPGALRPETGRPQALLYLG